MRNRFLQAGILVFVMVASLLAGAPAGSAPVDTIGPAAFIRPVPDGYRFQNGMVLHYDAEWRLWKAGTATIRLDSVGAEERVTANADSIGVTAMLYRVQDRFESYFDRRTFCSSRIVKRATEGLHQRDTTIRFDTFHRKAVLDERNLRTGQTKHTEQDIPSCVTDVLSGMYYLGSLPLEPGSSYLFPINDGGQTVNVRAVVEAREEIKTDAGTFRTVRVQPSSDSGPLKARGKVWIWYTDDANHIPVQVRTRLFWGTLNISLVRIDHEAANASAADTSH